MKINYYLRDKNATVDTPIEFVIQYAFTEVNDSGKKVYKKIKRSTGLSIKPKHWNEKSQTARESYDKCQKINLRIIEITNFIHSIEKEFLKNKVVLTIDLLKEHLNVFFKGDSSKPKHENLLEFTKNLIDEKQQKQYKRILNQTFNVLNDFSKTKNYYLNYETIDVVFYKKFVNYLNERNYAPNTKAKHITNLKYFMNEAMKENKHLNFAYKGFKTKKVSFKKIVLNPNEINILYKLDLSLYPRLERVRDLFVIGCYTGLRFSDFTIIKSSNIKERKLFINTEKTDTDVVIPLRPEVISIFNKYNGEIPKPLTNKCMNEYIKEVGEKAAINEETLIYNIKGLEKTSCIKLKYKLICTHTARRSFATNCYNEKIPPKNIMLITGHKTESEFFKYIQIDENKNADDLLKHPFFNPDLEN